MNGLESIPVAVVSDGQDGLEGDLALPVLHQVAAMLDTLLSSGQCGSIDLHRTPLGSADRNKLEEVLGRGELSAQFDCLGPTRIHETGISGVWWVTHCDEQSRILGEFIEVTMCPEMFQCSQPDARTGLRRLQTRLSAQARPADQGAIADRLEAIGIHPRAPLSDISRSNQSLKRGNGDAD